MVNVNILDAYDKDAHTMRIKLAPTESISQPGVGAFILKDATVTVLYAADGTILRVVVKPMPDAERANRVQA